MIAFACAISDPVAYKRYAEPGIRLAAEPDSEVFALASVDTIARSHNLLLDAASRCAGLEALVIVHPHAQIDDPGLAGKVRAALSDQDVAVVGCAGATGVETIAWWEGRTSCGPVIHRYSENGGGEFAAWDWTNPAPAPAPADALDGFLLVLSPWAVSNLRFDEALVLGHGYDVDICLQARRAGRKVMTADIRVIEHRALAMVSELDLWTEAHIAFARKWEVPTPDWKARARRAEAEREASRAIAYFRRLGFDARVDALERELAAATSTFSWRLTKPLRRLNQWRRTR